MLLMRRIVNMDNSSSGSSNSSQQQLQLWQQHRNGSNMNIAPCKLICAYVLKQMFAGGNQPQQQQQQQQQLATNVALAIAISQQLSSVAIAT
ncbi:hypothetical protein AWZ03_000028 [Drosophila navojoa]|uniref:Uncharacterized protein n=1 Tax=Drosophila navojoa TaxID=7232 RepID=A0A484BWY9_DRONA|nr:hypothetical protein AWZ03_000028 [Drosophila navojoa]